MNDKFRLYERKITQICKVHAPIPDYLKFQSTKCKTIGSKVQATTLICCDPTPTLTDFSQSLEA